MKGCLMVGVMLLFVFMCSCGQGGRATNKNTTQIDSLIYNPNLHIGQLVPKGIWVNSKYMEVLKHTNSPYAAQKVFWEEGASDIDWVFIKSDSLWNGYNLHEGNDYMPVRMINVTDFHVFRQDELYLKGHFRNNYQELVFEVTDYPMAELSFYPYPSFDEMLHGVLFAGTYAQYDSMGGQLQEATLSPNGKANGIEEFDGYTVFYDFNGPGMNLDQLVLTKGEDSPLYGWTIDKDTLIIHHLNCLETMEDGECGVFELGGVYRKLEKQH